jgi:methylmalonyl-CoA mutase
VTKVVDPLAGSYYVESLTNELAKGLGADRGGRGDGRHDQGRRLGMPKLRIEESAARRQAMIDRATR